MTGAFATALHTASPPTASYREMRRAVVELVRGWDREWRPEPFAVPTVAPLAGSTINEFQHAPVGRWED